MKQLNWWKVQSEVVWGIKMKNIRFYEAEKYKTADYEIVDEKVDMPKYILEII